MNTTITHSKLLDENIGIKACISRNKFDLSSKISTVKTLLEEVLTDYFDEDGGTNEKFDAFLDTLEEKKVKEILNSTRNIFEFLKIIPKLLK